MEKIKKISKSIFFILIVIYEEIIFSAFVFKHVSSSVAFIILFSIPIGVLLDLLTSFFKEKGNKIVSYIITIIICILFSAHFIYNKIYQSIISIYSFANGKQVFQFYQTILEVIKNNFLIIFLFMLPIILLIILHKCQKINFDKNNWKEKIIKLIVLIVIQVVATLSVSIGKQEGLYSNKNLYYNSSSLLMTARRFGICTTMRLDLKRLIFKSNEDEAIAVINQIIEQPEELKEKNNEIEYNKLEIDFDELEKNEQNSNISAIHKYMAVQTPSKKNEYTGIFKGKNLIVIVAESFSNIGIREDTTPTLYKLSKEGFEFKNFYTPLFPVSTADGEYITDTSLIPKEGVWSMTAIRNNYMPYSYANVFEKLGYSSNAYHNHTASYYDRDKYINAMGYDSYLATYTGLEKRMNCTRWPNSDLEMVQVTTEDYMNNDKFVAYYMTVSGHLNYTTDGNYIAYKNWDLVKDLPYSHRAKAYLATQIELDRAVEQLIKSLEEKGKLEDTVIVISGDHYPYGLELDEINEISTYERDNTFEKYNMPLIIWSASMEEPVVVEKIGSSLDVLPTVLNLFGVEYDSRLLMGRDILSDSDPLVIFSDRSFITDKGKYNAITGEFINSTDTPVDADYIDRIRKIIEAKFQISKLILERDYYRIIKDYID